MERSANHEEEYYQEGSIDLGEDGNDPQPPYNLQQENFPSYSDSQSESISQLKSIFQSVSKSSYLREPKIDEIANDKFVQFYAKISKDWTTFEKRHYQKRLIKFYKKVYEVAIPAMKRCIRPDYDKDEVLQLHREEIRLRKIQAQSIVQIQRNEYQLLELEQQLMEAKLQLKKQQLIKEKREKKLKQAVEEEKEVEEIMHQLGKMGVSLEKDRLVEGSTVIKIDNATKGPKIAKINLNNKEEIANSIKFASTLL